MSRVASVLARWVVFCFVHPWGVLGALALAAAVSGAAAWRFAAIDSDLSRLIRPSAELPWYRHDVEFKAAFPMLQQTAVVAVSGRDGRAVDTTTRRLAERLRERPELDFVYAPGVDPFLRDHRLYFVDPALLRDWRRGLQVDYGALLRLADDASLVNAAVTFADQVSAGSGLPLPDPLASLADSFAGDGPADIAIDAYPPLEAPGDGRRWGVIQVKGPAHHDQALSGAELVGLLRDVVRETPAEPGVKVRLSGEVALAYEEIGAALKGIGIAGTVSLGLLAVILGAGIRSLRVIGGIFLLLLLGSALTLGFATVAVGTFNTLALMFVIMFFGLGVDFAVHFALRVREAADGASVAEGRAALAGACATAAADIGPALLLCVATTCIAFLSFVPTAYRGLAELGIISSGGMVIAMLLTLTLMPALFGAFGLPVARPPAPHRRPPIGERLSALPVLAVTTLLALAAVWWARDLRFDYSVLALRDAGTEGMSTLLDLQHDGVTTDYSISVLAPDAAAASALSARLQRLPRVAGVSSPADWIPHEQTRKRDLLREAAALIDTIGPVSRGESGEALPEAIGYLASVSDAVPVDRQAAYSALLGGLRRVAGDAAEVERLDTALAAALEGQLEELHRLLAAEPFGLDDLPADIRARMITSDGRLLLRVDPSEPLDSRESTEAFIDEVASVAPNFAGRAVVEWGVGEVVVRSFLEAAALAVITIVVLLIGYFRSLRLPLLVLTPLLLATLFTFALAEAFGLGLNMANVLVVPLIFGLGVDTGIHVVHRFTAAGNLHAVFASSTARAVAISGLTTIGTFFSLSFSPHKGAASVGILLSLAIGLMLVVTYAVLPALLRVAAPRPRRANGPQAPDDGDHAI